MDSKLAKELQFLKAYLVAAILCCLALITAMIKQQRWKQKFKEIDVERINIVEKDGQIKMVISNEERQHPGIVNGKIISREERRPPGMIFFNHLGDEMGGLLYGDNGGDGHFGTLTWDKVRNDQTIAFRHLESDDGAYQSGLELWQQPNLPSDVVQEKYEAVSKIADEKMREAAIQAMVDNQELTTNRLFLGKRRDNSVMLVLSDMKGKPRIRMEVTSEGKPKLEFWDEDDQVIASLPTSSSTPT